MFGEIPSRAKHDEHPGLKSPRQTEISEAELQYPFVRTGA
jgi:hypothetical protein